jgi:hypothetical protein
MAGSGINLGSWQYSGISNRLEGEALGAEDQNRTGDTLIFSQVLYQLSYLGTVRDCTSPDYVCQANIFVWHLKLETKLINPC